MSKLIRSPSKPSNMSKQTVYSEETRTILRRIYLVMAIATTSIALVNLFTGNARAAALVGVLALVAMGNLQLLKKAQVTATIFITTISIIGIYTLILTVGNGIRETGTAYATALIFSSLILKRKTMLFIIAFILLCIAWLVLGEMNGWFVIDYTPHSPFVALVSNSILITATAVVSYYLISINKRSLKSAILEVENQKQLEDEKKGTINDNLEQVDKYNQHVSSMLNMATTILDIELMNKSARNGEILDLRNHTQSIKTARQPNIANNLLAEIKLSDYIANLKTKGASIALETEAMISANKASQLGLIIMEVIKAGKRPQVTIDKNDKDQSHEKEKCPFFIGQ